MVYRFLDKFSAAGKFIPHTRKKALPVGFKQPEPLAVQVARLVRSEQLKMAAEQAGMETFEEADDFDIPDDPIDPTTPYEQDFDNAAISAEKYGVVAPFDTKAGRDALEKVKSKKARKPVDSQKSEGGEPSDSDSTD